MFQALVPSMLNASAGMTGDQFETYSSQYYSKRWINAHLREHTGSVWRPQYPGRAIAMADCGHVLLTAPDTLNRSLLPDGLHPNTNPHWRPQRFMCNMEKFLPAYNFVGSFDHLGDHAEKLLRALGLWEAYGAAGWTKALKRTVVDKIKGAVGGGDDGGRMFQKNAAWHQTTKMKPENHDLYTPELLAKVRRAYAMDYEMFDAVGFGGDEPASGANWGDAKYAGRQTMGGFDRAFKDDHGVRAWS